MNDRPVPQNVTQAVSRAADDVIGSLKHQPVMMFIVLLNAIGIGASLWFLLEIAEQSDKRFLHLMQYCLPLNHSTGKYNLQDAPEHVRNSVPQHLKKKTTEGGKVE